MDPYRFPPPSYRKGSSHDFSLLMVFLLTIALMGGVVAVLTVGSAWRLPDLPKIQPLGTRSSNLFGASALDQPPASLPADPSPTATPTTKPAGALVATARPASPTSTPTTAPTATPTQVSPTPAAPTATPAQASPTPTGAAAVYVVGNTDGVGVWLRRSPRLNDYLISWKDGTRMVTIGPDVQANGMVWHHVQDPRGNQGYIPAQWLVPAN